MIDFRYHLVSIVSIFLALAVGIVLGAGPLQGSIGSTLTSEVTRLRSDKDTLRTELDQATKGIQARDAFTAATNKQLLTGRLQGRTVAIVALPGADGAVVKTTGTTLTDAGARVGAVVTVQAGWTDPAPAKASVRQTVGSRLGDGLGLAGDTADPDQHLDAVLAAVLVRRVGASTPAAARTGLPSGPPAAAAVAGALQQLQGADLISYQPTQPALASALVVIGGPVSSGDATEQAYRATASAELAAVLDRQGNGAVLCSNTGLVPDPSGPSVVSVARKDVDISKVLSTVDDAGAPIGQASIVLALVEQYAGGTGQYGLAPDAKAAFPQPAGP